MNSDFFKVDNLADQKVAIFIAERTSHSVGNFFVVNKKGVHILYENNYPLEATIWLPTPPGKDYRKNPKLVDNAYDNAVHYNLELFFRALFPKEDAIDHTIVVYTSDHGQTLQEKGEFWSHCNNTRPEVMVPLLIVGKVHAMPDTRFHASHGNIFVTLLDLMGVPVSARTHAYAPSLFTATVAQNQPRYFADGDLTPVNFDP